MTAKEEVLKVLESLPDTAGAEEAIDRLYLLYKVQHGLSQADHGDKVSQEEARRRMAKWLR